MTKQTLSLRPEAPIEEPDESCRSLHRRKPPIFGAHFHLIYMQLLARSRVELKLVIFEPRFREGSTDYLPLWGQMRNTSYLSPALESSSKLGFE